MFVIWNEEGGENGDNGTTGAADAAAGHDQGNDSNKNKPSDAEAKLLKEVMEKKEAANKAKQAAEAAEARAKELETKLAQFDGVDLEQVKELLKERQDREHAELEKRGEFDRLKASIVEQHQKELTSTKTEAENKVKELADKLAKRESVITELTIGRSFSDSNFIREQLTLTPNKARVVYGTHFEVQDGKVVAYDKPVGSENRTPLVDANGEALPFDKAIEKLVELDPDRDNLLKSSMHAGSGSENDANIRRRPDPNTKLTGAARIAAAIAAGQLPKLPQ